MTPEQALAKAIKMRRVELDLTQEDLADLCDCDRSYISQVERAVVSPSMTLFRKISKALKITTSELMQDAERRE